MVDTKQRILNTAERLFGEQGYAATSMRQIIAEAAVNLAAIHYHFGSKEELLDGVVLRKAGPVNERRLALLDQVEARAAGGRPAVSKILEAFLLPMAEAADDHPEFVRLMGRIMTEGLLIRIVQKHFQSVLLRFTEALHRALPELPYEELLWRVHFMAGAIAHTMCGMPAPAIPEASGFRERVRKLAGFLAAGIQAPATQPEEVEVR